MKTLQDCVLVVDDEVLIADLWCMVLEDMGIVVCGVAPSADEAVALAETHRPRLVLMDLRLKGGGDGVDAALRIGASVGSKMIFITGSKEPSALDRIRTCEPTAILFKPILDWQLQSAVTDALAT